MEGLVEYSVIAFILSELQECQLIEAALALTAVKIGNI